MLLQRKKLRLENYDYSQCNAYFVTLCTHNRQQLFGTIEPLPVGATLRGRPNNPDKMIEKWINELENKFYEVRIDCFCIMPDHLHLIIVIQNRNGSGLEKIISWLKTMTTNEYIRGVKSGLFLPFENKVWQRSYYDHIIRDEQDLNEKRDYILTNPIRWLEKTSCPD
ncbi:MAG: transposase [Clostridia bacterium]|nr:transposase [Clostridia bacterium]